MTRAFNGGTLAGGADWPVLVPALPPVLPSGAASAGAAGARTGADPLCTGPNAAFPPDTRERLAVVPAPLAVAPPDPTASDGEVAAPASPEADGVPLLFAVEVAPPRAIGTAISAAAAVAPMAHQPRRDGGQSCRGSSTRGEICSRSLSTASAGTS